VAAKKCQESLVAFYRAYKILMLVRRLISAAELAVKGLRGLADLCHLATHVPEVVNDEVTRLEDLAGALGAVPGHLGDLSHLWDTPTAPYGGPRAPGIG
jgi:hypothetical protein